MLDAQDSITVAVKACASCGGGLLEYDKFCRWCGVLQPGFATGERANNSASMNPSSRNLSSKGLSAYQTSALDQAGASSSLYHRVSGPLVSAVVAGVVAGSTQEQNQFVKRAILALISIPIWLIIVLLSPLDAYVAAKNLLR
ncbi:MAG TPA: hypothetical protein VJZ26_04510 [Blastocatellia bacterium]|nr:hypothetical protein [Blastocatellia bacterium]